MAMCLAFIVEALPTPNASFTTHSVGLVVLPGMAFQITSSPDPQEYATFVADRTRVMTTLQYGSMSFHIL